MFVDVKTNICIMCAMLAHTTSGQVSQVAYHTASLSSNKTVFNYNANVYIKRRKRYTLRNKY